MHTVTVTFNRPAGTQMRWIQLDWIPEAYTTPGQFIQATIGDLKPGFFAIASDPGKPIELLLKNAGPAAEALCAAQPGDSVQATDPMGKGFPVSRTEHRDWVVLVNGSGISAIRPVINQAIRDGLTRDIHLLLGVKTPAHRAFLADLEWWANAGVHVHTVCSEGEAAGWYGATGFVQDTATALGLVNDEVSVLLCGYPAMAEAAKALYATAGCPETQVLTNF